MSTCIVLAGGLGTRLRPVLADRPKCLAPVGDTSFLALQLRMLASHGATRFVLALGHLAGMVLEAVEPLRQEFGIEAVVEPHALGTGGALLHAMHMAGLEECMATNGDTWLDADLGALLAPLALAQGEQLRIGLTAVDDAARYGAVRLAADGRVAGFAPRGTSGPALINAGLYRLHRSAFGARRIGEAFSFESELMPPLVAGGAVGSARLSGEFTDIGVPEDYARFCAGHAVVMSSG
jgi:D-glycero-alpha-D-manno-heptose 1-phosphate guanylyltransferase